ncbi:MocR-like pyridoxine biosynthesis transcription factor PdxR [Photobacterium leiognathi]|uniref:MocR-like pyridoxine biosynthesis transcription factor PdxR n=1 Tax=Photobacterium leiognathi TaxID=553611 RepID=UPI002981750E|nr:PLP-dependent aminotransferase family protein [Photobacterium leiognathi]
MNGSSLKIDIGDLTLSAQQSSRQTALFIAIRDKITQGYWETNSKLPSTRQLSQALSVSRNTVIAAYEQLVAEGYIQSKASSGYYISARLPEHYLTTAHNQHALAPTSLQPQVNNTNNAFAPGVPDLAHFPSKKWQRLYQQQFDRKSFLGCNDLQGDINFRQVLSHYLKTSRSVNVSAERIIVTSGAQQALMMTIMATTQPNDTVLVENPGYTQMRKALSLYNVNIAPLPVSPFTGINMEQLAQTKVKAIYITPSNQYPLGTTLNISQRIQLLEWASLHNVTIIEDDYDSEFQYAHRPYPSLQGLAYQTGIKVNIIYIGTFSKIMCNSIRLGYMVVPNPLVSRYLEIKDALSGETQIQLQLAMTEFIQAGDLLRHIRKMRRLYQAKHQHILQSIEKYSSKHWQVISQAAGLHVTVKWQVPVCEKRFAKCALQQGIIIRPLNYYEQPDTRRNWHGVVLGFGNTHLDDIPTLISKLYAIFISLLNEQVQ